MFSGECSSLQELLLGWAQVLVRNYWINTHCANAARTTLIVVARPMLRRVIMLEFLWVGSVFIFFVSYIPENSII